MSAFVQLLRKLLQVFSLHTNGVRSAYFLTVLGSAWACSLVTRACFAWWTCASVLFHLLSCWLF